MTLKGKQNKHFTVVNAYQCSKDQLSSRTIDTNWCQQFRTLRRECESDSDVSEPRDLFWKDLKTLLVSYKSKGHEVLLFLDSNDPTRKDGNTLNKDLGMFDLHVHKHGTEDEPETYFRGSKRIDFVYGTAGVVKSLRKCGIGAYGELCASDHRFLFVDWDLS